MSTIGMTLEIELGITGGEEDGVDNTDADQADLYSKPEEVAYAYERADRRSATGSRSPPPSATCTACTSRATSSCARASCATARSTSPRSSAPARKPVDFVFHGGSGSTAGEIAEAISYGVVKMNIDTDLQWAFWDGIRGYEADKHDYLQGQIGNPDGPDKPNKKQYDPRVWLRAGEESLRRPPRAGLRRAEQRRHARLIGSACTSAEAIVRSARVERRPTPSACDAMSHTPSSGRSLIVGGSGSGSAVISRRNVSTSARSRVRRIGGSALTMSQR